MSSSENTTIKTIATITGLIVSCIVIFTFVTGYSTLRDLFSPSESENQSNSSSDSESNQTSISAPTQEPQQESLSIPGAINNPSNGMIVPSTSPIVVEGYLLNYENDFYIGTSCINLGRFFIKNLSQRQRAFSYMYASVSLADDTGNTYPISSSRNNAYELRTLNISASGDDQAGMLTSCGCNCFGTGFTYDGTLSQNAKSLIITFKKFGVFDGFSIEVQIR